jgi:hypothetical protein
MSKKSAGSTSEESGPQGSSTTGLQVSTERNRPPLPTTEQRETATDYWRTHTHMNGHEQVLEDGGMCEGVTPKGRVFRYTVAYLK